MSRKKLFWGSLPNFGLLLYAVSPICQAKDWLYFPVILGCITAFVVVCIYLSRMKKKQILSFLYGTAQANLYMAIIGLIGIIVCLALNAQSIYFWIVVLVIGLLECIWPRNPA